MDITGTIAATRAARAFAWQPPLQQQLHVDRPLKPATLWAVLPRSAVSALSPRLLQTDQTHPCCCCCLGGIGSLQVSFLGSPRHLGSSRPSKLPPKSTWRQAVAQAIAVSSAAATTATEAWAATRVAEPGSSWVQGLLGCGRVAGRLCPLSASSEGQVVATAATAVPAGVPAR